MSHREKSLGFAGLLVFGLLGPRVAATQHVAPVFGVHYGFPLKWSAVAGVGVHMNSNENTVFLAGEPGIGGWRASVGFTRMMSGLGAGYSVRSSYLRTTSRAWLVNPDESFLGAEFHFMPVFGLGARVGWFRGRGRIRAALAFHGRPLLRALGTSCLRRFGSGRLENCL